MQNRPSENRPPLEDSFEIVALLVFILSALLFLVAGLIEGYPAYTGIAPILQKVFACMTVLSALGILVSRLCLARCLRSCNYVEADIEVAAIEAHSAPQSPVPLTTSSVPATSPAIAITHPTVSTTIELSPSTPSFPEEKRMREANP